MRQNIHKAAALLKELAPWFALKNYELLDVASPKDWFNQFALRIDLERMRRSLRLGSSDTAFKHWRTVHSCMVSLVREGFVRQETITDVIVRYEELLAPEGFSTLAFLRPEGRYMRLLTMADFLRICSELNNHALDTAAAAYRSAPGGYPLPVVPMNHDSATLFDPVLTHMRGLSARCQSFIAFDLQMPKSVLTRQFDELVDQLQKSSLPVAPHADRSAKQTHTAWVKSRVLPYIDLCQWRDDLADQESKERFTRVAIASALEIEPDTLAKVTKVHAEELTDERSWTFMQLVEDAISFHRNADPERKFRKNKV